MMLVIMLLDPILTQYSLRIKAGFFLRIILLEYNLWINKWISNGLFG